jgi:integrase
MGTHKGIIYAANERMEALTKLRTSRFKAKAAAHEAGEKTWPFTTGTMNSHGTRNGYQEHVMHFIKWVRATHGVRRLEILDARADELASLYLTERVARGKSPYTVQAERSALRLFFGQRDLAEAVAIPERRREQIKRSRGPAKRDTEFQPANWQVLIRFLRATGLRRDEARRLQVEDIQRDSATGVLEVWIKQGHGKGGKPRRIPVLAEHEPDVLVVIGGQRDPSELVFGRIPSRLDIQAIRRAFAQMLYQYHSGRELPPKEGRLRRVDYDYAAAQRVSWSLGHNRVDVVLRHYLR